MGPSGRRAGHLWCAARPADTGLSHSRSRTRAMWLRPEQSGGRSRSCASTRPDGRSPSRSRAWSYRGDNANCPRLPAAPGMSPSHVAGCEGANDADLHPGTGRPYCPDQTAVQPVPSRGTRLSNGTSILTRDGSNRAPRRAGSTRTRSTISRRSSRRCPKSASAQSSRRRGAEQGGARWLRRSSRATARPPAPASS